MLQSIKFQLFCYGKVICKIRKTEHHNPEFVHTHGDVKKNLQNNTLSFMGEGGGLKKPSILVIN
jgi:hypothetical protein